MYNTLFGKKQVNAIHFSDSNAIKIMTENLISHLPRQTSTVVVVCIGTDRSTGDSLGPLTGTYLSNMTPKQLHVVGTLHDPVHAINLDEKLTAIKKAYDSPFIIAVDASLGRQTSIGNLISGEGPLKPGAALKKNLTPVGDIHLTGVVNIGGYMDFAVLQSTRLSIVHDMAHQIAVILKNIDKWLYFHHFNQHITNHSPVQLDKIVSRGTI